MARVDVGATSHANDELLTFDYFGEELRVSPDLTDADLLDFLEVQADLKADDPKAGPIVKSFLRTVVHVDDFDRFWALAKQHRQSVDERSETAFKLIEAAVNGTPTEQSSDSSAGLQSTDSSSTADLSSTDATSLRVQRRLEQQGRADLAVAVLQRREGLRVA
jgi:hypothetical protein